MKRTNERKLPGPLLRIRADRYDFVITAIQIVLAATFYSGVISSAPYTYDEADYMYAASRGFSANYLDRDVLPFSTFVDRGWAALAHPEERFALSEFIRNSTDISFYRHYHGPLYFYWLMAFDEGNGSEYVMRWASFFLLFVTVVIVHVGCRTLLKGDSRAGAIVASSLVAFSPTLSATASRITPHAIFIPALLITLFLLGLARQRCDSRLFSVATVCSALAIASIEFAVLLVLTILLLAYHWRRSLFPDADVWRDAFVRVLVAFGFAILVLFILWPGGFFKLTLIRNYLFFAYFAVSSGEQYGNTPIMNLWLNRALASPVEYAGAVTGILGLAWVWRRQSHPELHPFLLYAALQALTSARNRSGLVTYVAALLPPLFVVAGGVAATLLERQRKIIGRVAIAAITVVTAVAAAMDFHIVGTTRIVDDREPSRLLAWAAERRPTQGPVLVPYSMVPTLHYYQRNLAVVPYDQEPPDILAARARERGVSDIIIMDDRSQPMIALLSVDHSVRVDTIASVPQRPPMLNIHLE